MGSSNMLLFVLIFVVPSSIPNLIEPKRSDVSQNARLSPHDTMCSRLHHNDYGIDSPPYVNDPPQ